MATVGVRAVRLYNGSEKDYGKVFGLPEKASQTFVRGDWVKTDTNGQVSLAVDTESGLYGLAMADASGTTDDLVDILLVDATMLFVASQSNAGAAQVTVQTQVGLQCSWIKSTVTGETTKTVVDTADTTTPDLEILYLDTRDAVGDSNGRVVFKILDSRLIARSV